MTRLLPEPISMGGDRHMIAAIQIVGLMVAVYTSWRFLEKIDSSKKQLPSKTLAGLALLIQLGLAVWLLRIGLDNSAVSGALETPHTNKELPWPAPTGSETGKVVLPIPPSADTYVSQEASFREKAVVGDAWLLTASVGLRTEPGASGAFIVRLPIGTVIQVLEGGAWARVAVLDVNYRPTVRGWIRAYEVQAKRLKR
jgi:hypothetical protein